MITYNHAPYIAQAIEGVLQQKTDFPFELVIGEDFSTDGTRDIVFEYQKGYPDIIRVITSNKNVGSKENSLRTTRACQGKYIAWCEGDDYWHNPFKLQKQVDYLERDPECGFVYSSYDIYHAASRKKIPDFIKYRKWEMPEHLQISDFIEKNEVGFGILTCTVMARWSIYKQIIESDPYLHQSGKFLMGDTQLWAEISHISRVHYIPESLATHIITEESATRSKDPKKALRFRNSQIELGFYLYTKYNLPERIRNTLESNWCDCSLRLAFYERNTNLANSVRRKKEAFTWPEWIRYYGSKYFILHYGIRAGTFFLNIFRKKYDYWL